MVAHAPALVFAFALAASSPSGLDPDLLAGMKARSIGPAGMSGRIAAIEAVVSDPDVIYVGAATGGVWKSTNAGLTWKPIFDDQPVAAIGAVAVFQPAPDLVWVGTGEGNPRNSASVGNGIYRSLDGGHSWAHLGLAETERIHRIVLHPSDPDVAYVAALGKTWGENAERGVFRTTDGGKTWKKVLYVDERTGAADLVMDPSNPRKLIAAMWDHRRWPWSFRSGGPGSGIHVTTDGGETWAKLTPEDGLPEGELGRIGLAISASHPNVVYAFVEAREQNAVYVSRDGGRRWSKAGESKDAGNRPFYYADIRVDPEWPDRVYSLWSLVSVSDDGGKSFRVLVPFRAVHPDHHALWINPSDPSQLLLGNDGGVAISEDRGETWRFVANLPLAQYYHVRVDGERPYNVYGGMQDNGSWRGPSSVWENGGIRNHHWEEVGFGDGFDTAPHPEDSMIGYAMSQEGFLRRWELRTGTRKDIRPPAPEGAELRFNWNAGFAQDPFEPDTIYYGSQFVHRSRDRGDTWETISGDLTSDNPEWQKQDESGGLTPDVTGAENFTAIVAIAPSPIAKGVLWVGTDDGRLHVSRDGGASWASVEKNLQGVPANTWIPHVEPSRFDAGEAFVVLDDHRRSNATPYVFRTTDYGASWTSLATKQLSGYCLSIAQDPVERELLFLGTEFGLFVSRTGGKSWWKWTHGVPTVSVMDLVVHPREHDLVLGTHGRAAFVLDDVRPLRTLDDAVRAKPIHLFEPPEAQQHAVKQTGASRFPGHGEFRGQNRPYGALVTFWLDAPGLPHPDEEQEKARKLAERKEKQGGAGAEAAAGSEEKKGPEARITILGPDGERVRRFEAAVHRGLNRAVWDLKHDAFDEPPRDEQRFFEPSGPDVLPGVYTVEVEYQEHVATGNVTVLADPRFEIARADREAKLAAQRRAGALQETLSAGVRRIQDARADVDGVRRKARADAAAKKAADEPPHKALLEAAKKLDETLDRVEERLWTPPRVKGIVAEKDALSKVEYALRNLGSAWDAPTPAQQAYLAVAERVLAAALEAVNRAFAEDVAAFRAQAQAAGFGLLPEAPPLALP